MAQYLMAAACAALVLVGCTTTRTVQVGILPNQVPLVVLVVTEDRTLVGRQCQGQDTDRVLGCQILRPVGLDQQSIRAFTIVRYTDALPSEMALEVEAHELCHAVAGLQSIPDPCHHENDGILQSGLPPRGLVIRPY